MLTGLQNSRSLGDNGSRDAPPIGISSALALSFAALSIGGVWAMMFYCTIQFFRCNPQLAVLQTGVVESSTPLQPASRGCSSDDALDALLRPLVPYTLALLCSALGWFLGRWYFIYQRSPSGAVDRVDDVPAFWQMILEYPFGSPPNSRQTFLRLLLWSHSPRACAAGGSLHTCASSQRSRPVVSSTVRSTTLSLLTSSLARAPTAG